MSAFFLIIGFFLLGLAYRFCFSSVQGLTDGLNFYAIHVALPALILTIVPSITLSFDVLIPSLSFWILVPFTWFLTKKINQYFKWTKEIECVCFIFLTFGNTAFLGIPMMKALLEDKYIIYALLYDQLGIFLGLATIAVIVIARFEKKESQLNFYSLSKKIITFTPFPALLVSLLLPIESLLIPLVPTLTFLGQLIVPATMIVVGLQFSLKIQKQYYLPIGIILFIKMMVLPAVAWMVLSLLSVDPVMIVGIVFQVAAPPMITVAGMLISARIAVPLVASTLGLGTVLSFLLWPLWAYLLTQYA